MAAIEKGIVTGCPISIVLFVLGMNMIIIAAERETRDLQEQVLYSGRRGQKRSTSVKKAKYQDLADVCRVNKCSKWLSPVVI